MYLHSPSIFFYPGSVRERFIGFIDQVESFYFLRRLLDRSEKGHVRKGSGFWSCGSMSLCIHRTLYPIP